MKTGNPLSLHRRFTVVKGDRLRSCLTGTFCHKELWGEAVPLHLPTAVVGNLLEFGM